MNAEKNFQGKFLEKENFILFVTFFLPYGQVKHFQYKFRKKNIQKYSRVSD